MARKTCPHCKARIPADETVCPRCGCSTEPEAAPQEPAVRTVIKTVEVPVTKTVIKTVEVPVTKTVVKTGEVPVTRTEAQRVGVPVNKPVVRPAEASSPAAQLRTDRGIIRFVLLSVLTLGIYAIVEFTRIGNDINLIASRHGEKKTMHFCLVLFVYTILSLGIVPLVWTHRLCAKIGRELRRRSIDYSFGAGTFWGWTIAGIALQYFILHNGGFGFGVFWDHFLPSICSLIYLHKLFTSMNLLSADYNQHG